MLTQRAMSMDGVARVSATSSGRRYSVAQVIGSFAGGGAQRVPLDLASELASMGHRSVGIAIREVGLDTSRQRARVEFRELGVRRSDACTLASAVLELRRIIREFAVDVVHVHGTGALPIVMAAAMVCVPRPRLCFTWHDSGEVLERRGMTRHVLGACVRRCDWVSGSSRSVAQRLSRNARVKQVSVFHGGVPAAPSPPEHGRERQGIVWVGRVCPNKNPEMLVRAIGALRAMGLPASATCAGSPFPKTVKYASTVRSAVAEAGAEGLVEFPGQMSREQITDLLARSAIGVQTSHSEGLSLALLEQMMAGLAIVATDVGDTSEAIIPDKTGLLIPAGNVDALVAALRRLIVDAALRERLGAGARALAMERFSIGAMARRALIEYERVLTDSV